MPPKTKKSKSKKSLSSTNSAELNVEDDFPGCFYCKNHPKDANGNLLTYAQIYANKGACDIAPDCMPEKEAIEDFGDNGVSYPNAEEIK